jgi:glutathione S-transferase
MKLLHQTHSPFARKVLVFAYETDLAVPLQSVDEGHGILLA